MKTSCWLGPPTLGTSSRVAEGSGTICGELIQRGSGGGLRNTDTKPDGRSVLLREPLPTAPGDGVALGKVTRHRIPVLERVSDPLRWDLNLVTVPSGQAQGVAHAVDRGHPSTGAVEQLEPVVVACDDDLVADSEGPRVFVVTDVLVLRAEEVVLAQEGAYGVVDGAHVAVARG
jgi:hypothetical protein